MTKFIMFKKNIFLFFLASFLSGCAGMNDKFDCNVGSGGKCAPMNHINKMADYGAFYRSSAHDMKESMQATNKNSRYPLNAFDGAPIRSNESIQQIWIGPYEDTNGNYHEPAYVYTVVKKGQWIGDPAKVIQD